MKKNPTLRQSKPPLHFPIVGIGASAGGLEAFTQLLKHLPTDTGMGLVLIQHLDPTHESELTRILARATTMPTVEVTHHMRVEPNHVHVIPPNVNMVIVNGVLELSPRPPGRTPHHPIDVFLESLAQDQRERAIGVILSGTATDGTLGLDAVKAEGGITFAQDESAKYDSMPRSAVAAGCVDSVLSPANIAKELARIAKHPYVVGSATDPITPDTSGEDAGAAGENERETATAHQHDASALPSGGHGTPSVGAKQARAEAKRGRSRPEDEGFKKILLLLRNHCGVDFSLYKSTTIQRRIARRMVFTKHNGFAHYATFLRGNVKELDTLFSDVLISVTSFFRNPEAFDVLKRAVFPKLVKQRRDAVVRVWVLGCSTGQEAYSIGMAFSEFAEHVPSAPNLQIFATDLNDALLEKARAGLYTKSLAVDISPERLRRFFVEEGGGYRVIKPLRQSVVFARQNLISDPPFSRMDLICCRNVLIYLEPTLQKRAFSAFHYALKPEGFLFLGASESVGEFTTLFESVDKKQKIFAKKAVATPPQHLSELATHSTVEKRRPSTWRPALEEGLRTEFSAQREADRLTVNEFAPPGVLINADLQIIQFRGSTSAYLDPPRGKASFDVLKMAREGLMLPLRAAITKAKKENKTVRKDNVRVGENESARSVDVQVVPLRNLKEPCYLILFEEVRRFAGDAVAGRRQRGGGAEVSTKASKTFSAPSTASRAAGERPGVRALRQRLAECERELAETRDYLQAVQQQHDAATEELQASSEEAQSANEELQSINEEMETSKEELESTNEELTTVNEEMANRNTELSRITADLKNLHVSIHTAILVVGRDLTIRHFTPLAEKAFNLLATDVGRPLSGIRHVLLAPPDESARVTGESSGQPLDLEAVIHEVIDTVSVREREVQDQDGCWFSLRVRPYMTLDNKIDGAVLALVAIHALKLSQQEVKESGRRKDEFLAMLAHELRTPLAPIRNAMHILERTAGDAETTRGVIGMLQRQVGQMVRLVDDLLDVSRISQGKITLQRERIELAPVLSHAVETAQPYCRSMNQELTVRLPPQPIYLNADPTRLVQIMSNLLNNACKFTGSRGRIRLVAELEGEQVVIRTQDNGIGIAADQLPRIFEMFTQVDTSLARTPGGLGLGLALAKRLVEMHDGTIEAHSNGLGRGAELVVRLPVLREPPALLAPADMEQATSVPRRILVVDDNLDAVNSLAMVLTLSGHDVHTAHDGIEAVEAAAKLQPDMILLDIGLPKLDGYEACRRIRQQQGDKRVLLVALTGWGQEEDKRRSQEAGFDLHLVKPAEPAALERLLDSVRPPA
ncbi:MAG TPA: chemotaxis protein CheB [Casimicrobiaceae bacterium]|nr:chemotaxis protein CheB [Casimicrobiaceae bacterium]